MSKYIEWRTITFKHIAGDWAEDCSHSLPFYSPIDEYDVRTCEYCDGLFLALYPHIPRRENR